MHLPARGLRAFPILFLAFGLALYAASCSGGDHKPDPNGSGDGGTGTATSDQTYAGTDPAPAFPTGLKWFNVTEPPTLDALKGKIVLLDFWTAGCINCQHIIPDLKKLEAEFADSLVVIGVHSGKYATEHDDDTVREAIARYDLEHPVVNDPDFVFWDAYSANAWPTLVLIDPAGKLVGSHSGEGVYPLFQPIIAALGGEFAGQIDTTPFPVALDQSAASTVLSFPGAVLTDEAHDRLYIADSGHNRILEADMDGALIRVFGTGAAGFADGHADEAQFLDPQGLELSGDGSQLYVADTRNHALRVIDLDSGDVTTLAGTGERATAFPKAGDDPKTTALASPWGLLLHDGVLYIANAGTHQIWTYDFESKQLAVFAGTSREGIDDGDRLTMATLAQPSGMTTDGHYLYWVDPESSAVRRTPFDGEIVDSLVGTGLFDYGDSDGTGLQAKIQHPQGIGFVGGLLYIADTYNNKIKSVDPASFVVTTVAGNGDDKWADGSKEEASFNEPSGVAAYGDKVLIADTGNHLLRVYDPATGDTSTLQLSNIGVLSGSGAGRVLHVDLPAQSVAPGATNLRLKLSTPDGYHLNSLAPSSLDLTSSNPEVLELGESTISWSTDGSSVEIPIPVMLANGSTTLTFTGSAYFCAEGEEALCLIQQLEIVVPVEVSASASGGELVVQYELTPEA